MRCKSHTGYDIAMLQCQTGKNVMLVDDLYNSGLTMQYVAMRLKELGVFRVFGVTLVKSLSNK